jgi:hypothetical protein
MKTSGAPIKNKLRKMIAVAFQKVAFTWPSLIPDHTKRPIIRNAPMLTTAGTPRNSGAP